MARVDREPLDEAIAAHGAPEPGYMLTGWVLVAEWIGPDDTKHLTRLSSKPITTWAVDGMLHDALYGADWDDAGAGQAARD
jgi:hypothetical protein